MKKIYSCLLILTFFISCADDENTTQEISAAMVSNKESGDTLPAYSANPYDNAGRIYDALFDAYYDGTNRSKELHSVITQVETIANSNTLFLSSNGAGYQPLCKERILYLATRNVSDIAGIIGASNLSPTGKTSFANFLISFTALYDSETDASKMYNAVVKYEGTAITNELLTANDKRVILTTTSILRYSSYRAKKKPKKNTDPDWLISVGHAFGTEEGAEENEAKAIIESLITGIVSNP
jgi:methylmalonyl-CoA mutase cobalamin-binding subunit